MTQFSESHLQTIPFFSFISNPVSVYFLRGSKRESVSRLSKSICSFRLIDENLRYISVWSGTTSYDINSHRKTSFSNPASSTSISVSSLPGGRKGSGVYLWSGRQVFLRSSALTPHGRDKPQGRTIQEKLPSCQNMFVSVRNDLGISLTSPFYKTPLFSNP